MERICMAILGAAMLYGTWRFYRATQVEYAEYVPWRVTWAICAALVMLGAALIAHGMGLL